MSRLLTVLLLAGCAGRFHRVEHAPTAPLQVSAILIAPVRLTGTEPLGWRRFELAQRQVSVALTDAPRLATFGPAQVQISRWSEPGWLGNSAVPVLTREGQSLDEALLLRTTAERRVMSASQEREDSAGLRKGGHASQEERWLVTLDVVHPASREVLFEFEGDVEVDPFAPQTAEDEFDPAAGLTRLVEAMTREALSAIHRFEREGLPPAPADGWKVALSPAFTAAQPDAREQQADALQTEVWLQARARFLTPGLDDAQAALLARSPPSLLVLAGPPGVARGERIVAIDDGPPLPEVLARRRLKGPVRVRVGSHGVEREQVVPAR